MTAAREAPDLKERLSTEDLSPAQLHELRREIHCHVDLRSQVEGVLGEFGAISKKLSSENKAEVRRGTTRWLLGQDEEAIKVLEPARTSRERAYVLGNSYLEVGRAAEALEQLKEAHEADSSDLVASAALCEARIKAGRYEEAEAHVERLLKKDTGAEGHYLRGLLADLQGFHAEAVEAYEKALEAEPGHAKSLFRLAYIMDLSGEDSRALELYEQLRKLRPMHLHTMMNLGVLYEDRGDFERAAQCFESVLDYFPTHPRARLYLADAKASLTMYYDEDAARREAKIQQVLSQPVAELSFSPRVRNALIKLGVSTIGDLVSKSDEELLAVPNFGRTSLRELKEFLGSKGLTMVSSGAAAEEAGAPAAALAAAGEEVLQKNLADFEWSGRIRKVFEKLGIVTVSDLMSRTESELLKNKNLGQTSIKEIRKKLGQLGLAMPE
jgi:DNA-directed RNA polymerase subunit alpha